MERERGEVKGGGESEERKRERERERGELKGGKERESTEPLRENVIRLCSHTFW